MDMNNDDKSAGLEKYWVDGGWGVDILTGKQNRDHRDIDIDFDSESERKC